MGLRSSINAKCKDCIYDDANPGNWRQQVTWCTVTTCPLYEVRPTSASAREAPQIDQEGAAISAGEASE